MEFTPEIWAVAHELVARNTTTSSSSSTTPARPPIYKVIGLILAVCSGLFIGTSFVLKKTGLLKANAKYHEEAGEGYGYLKNAYWWTGMTLMIVGEICNFVAYAFVDAILVTPLGALSVVVTTILSAIFLKERLSFVGKVGCFNCIIGSVIIVMNAPSQSAVADIQEMKSYVLTPGFLSYAGVIILGSAFIALWVGPRYGKKSMLVYLSVCSLIGGLSVVATQGLGSAVVAQAGGKPQFNQWFLYLLLVFVIATLVTEIVFLNKALNLFNAALVTPTYYVFFTSATIVTSAVLFQGFKGTPIGIATVVMGFLQICAGVVLLQLSKSAKDVPDAAIFKGDLDQMREVAEQAQPETEPKADAIRAGASIIRRFSVTRQKMEQEEARRLREDKLKDQLEPLGENEIVEWDGLRRRKTVIGNSEFGSPMRRKTIHPPLGMSTFPDPHEEERREREDSNFFGNLRTRAQSVIPFKPKHATTDPEDRLRSPIHPVALTEIDVRSSKPDTPIVPYGPGSLEEAQERIYGYQPQEPSTRKGLLSSRSKPLPASPKPQTSQTSLDRLQPQEARRQFSFTNVFHRNSRTPDPNAEVPLPPSRSGLGSRQTSSSHIRTRAMKNATEEERLGLVKGDSHAALLEHSRESSPTRAPLQISHSQSSSSASESSSYPDEKKAISSTAAPRSHTRTVSMSDSDGDGEWQMTPASRNPSPPVSQQRSPPRVSSRRRPSPPAVYQPPLSNTNPNPADPIAVPQGQIQIPGPIPSRAPAAALDPSLTLSTSQNHTQTRTYLRNESGTSLVRTVSPEDYEASQARWEEQQWQLQQRQQQQQQQGQRRRPGGTGPAGGPFV